MIRNRPPSEDYDKNFDRIFKKKEPIWNPITARQQANTPWEKNVTPIKPTPEESASGFGD